MIGTRVKIAKAPTVGQHHWGRWGEIVDGPRILIGVRAYRVRVDMAGRETVQQTVWLPSSALLVPKKNTSQEKA